MDIYVVMLMYLNMEGKVSSKLMTTLAPAFQNAVSKPVADRAPSHMPSGTAQGFSANLKAPTSPTDTQTNHDDYSATNRVEPPLSQK